MAADDDFPDAPGSTAEAVARVVGEILAHGMERLPKMAREMAVAIRQRVEAYGQGRSVSAGDDLISSVERTAKMLLTCMQNGRPPGRQDLVSLTFVGNQRAREGIPQDDVRTALEVGSGTGYRFLLREADVGDWPPDVVLAAAAVISEQLGDYLATVKQALDEGYAEAEGQHASTGRSRREVSVANRLLDARWRNEREIRLEAERTGKPLGRVHRVLILVGTAKPTETPLAESARRFADMLDVRCLLEAVHWTPLPHLPAVVTLASAEEWDDLTASGSLERSAVSHGLIVVVSEDSESLTEVSHVYQRVQGDLGFVAAARKDPGVVNSRRLEMFSVIAGDGQDIGRMTQFVHRVLGPVYRHDNADVMRRLLDAYYRRFGKWKDVALAMGMHRNTMQPHVDKIQELTDLSWNDVADVHELLTAHRLGEFLRGEFDRLDSVD